MGATAQPKPKSSKTDPIHENLRLAGDDGRRDRRMDVLNPYTGDVVGTVAMATVDDVRRAFETAAAYRSPLSRSDRSDILRATSDAIASRRDEISDLITLESGLSKKDSFYETGRSVDVFRLASQVCILDDGEIFSCDITPQGQKRKIYTLREPVRAVSAITPFNHPLNQVAHKVAPSVASNNCMVLKPTEKTPLTALLLADILYDAGLPREMLQVVTGDPREIGDELITNPHAEVVTFTGGVEVGKMIAEKAGYKRTVLELGGNDPLIVMDDVDLDRAATLAANGSCKNSGQRCTAVKRLLVHEAVADDFAALVVEKAGALKVGDPMDPETDIGTVIDEDAAILFENRVNDAVEKGARLLLGGERQGAVFPPTVLDFVPEDCELVVQETFGPVAPIIRFKDVDDAIRIANSTAFGLSSGVCADKLETITRFISELKVGSVNIWEVPGYRIEMSPFGGIKDSGLGEKEGLFEAMKGLTNVKTYSLPWPV